MVNTCMAFKLRGTAAKSEMFARNSLVRLIHEERCDDEVTEQCKL